MRGSDEQTGSLFTYQSPESMVPVDHPLRVIRSVVNAALERLSGEFAKLYSPDGRASIAPEKLLRALLVQAFFGTGMRIEEVCALTTHQLDYVGCLLDAEDPYGVAELELVVTKGGKKRTVSIHHTLWQALNDYVGGEREAAMEEARKVAKKRGVRLEETDALFINGVEANKRDVGQAVSTNTIGRAFTRAVVKCGLAKTVHPYVVDPATGEPRVDDTSGHAKRGERSKARHSFHDLRHTFAVMFYRSEIEAKRPPPLKKLQQILGNTLLSTTTDIYLKRCDLDEVELSKAFSKLLRNLHDAAG